MQFVEAAVPIALFACIALSIKFVVDARVRRRLAETHASEELIRAMLQAEDQYRRVGALKWGIVLTLVGIAFGLIDGLGLDANDPATFGLLIGAAGAGMLGFHVISQRKS